jgi:TonB family protein
MQTQAILLAALVGASSLAVAQTPAVPTTSNPASAGPSFSLSDDIPNPEGYADAYSLDEVRYGGKHYTEEQQVARWQAELAAGRARAGVLLGAYSAYRALTPTDCDVARAALIKADELGSDQAAWQLAQLAGNSTCGAIDRPQLERWLKKAVTLDYPRAAEDLIIFYRNGTEPNAKVQQYTYARVAAGYWEANKVTVPREGFDAVALQEMEKNITAAERKSAEAEAANILAGMLKRHERFGVSPPVEFARGDAGSKTSFAGYSVDYRHECLWNLRNNCRGAQRLAYVEVTNKNADFVACKFEMRARDFVTGTAEAEPARRQVLIGPQATRKLLLTDVNDNPDKKALTGSCTPVPKLAANLAAGKCRARLQGSIDVDRFYPEAARARGIEGSTVVRYWLPPGADVPTDAEIVTSSGDASLDDAAVATIVSGKFASDCDYGLSSIRIAFKLQN